MAVRPGEPFPSGSVRPPAPASPATLSGTVTSLTHPGRVAGLGDTSEGGGTGGGLSPSPRAQEEA